MAYPQSDRPSAFVPHKSSFHWRRCRFCFSFRNNLGFGYKSFCFLIFPPFLRYIYSFPEQTCTFQEPNIKFWTIFYSKVTTFSITTTNLFLELNFPFPEQNFPFTKRTIFLEICLWLYYCVIISFLLSCHSASMLSEIRTSCLYSFFSTILQKKTGITPFVYRKQFFYHG